MKFFFSVLVVALITAIIASRRSPEEQIGVVSSFLHDLAAQAISVGKTIELDESEAGATTADADLTGPALDVAMPVGNDGKGGADAAISLQTVELQVVPDFKPVPAQVLRPGAAGLPAEPPPLPASPRAEPLEREQVSEMLRRLGVISRTAAKSAAKHDRRLK